MFRESAEIEQIAIHDQSIKPAFRIHLQKTEKALSFRKAESGSETITTNVGDGNNRGGAMFHTPCQSAWSTLPAMLRPRCLLRFLAGLLRNDFHRLLVPELNSR